MRGQPTTDVDPLQPFGITPAHAGTTEIKTKKGSDRQDLSSSMWTSLDDRFAYPSSFHEHFSISLVIPILKSIYFDFICHSFRQ